MPPCSIMPKWKAAVLAIACRCLRGPQVVVAAGDRGELPGCEARDRLREGVAEVGVLRVAAVARPVARVDGELHQVGEPSDLRCAGRLAAGEGAERVQVDRLRTARLQVRVDEVGVALLVVGVVVDVLVHVLVDDGERLGVGPISASAGDLAVLDAAELVVLLPEIGFEQLRGGEELENRRVARREGLAGERGRRVDQESPRTEGQGSGRGSLGEEGAAAGAMLRRLVHLGVLLLAGTGYRPCSPRQHLARVPEGGQGQTPDRPVGGCSAVVRRARKPLRALERGGGPRRLRSKRTASQIEPSNSAHIGSSSRKVVIGSGPGSARAMTVTTKYPTRRCLRSVRELRTPRPRMSQNELSQRPQTA